MYTYRHPRPAVTVDVVVLRKKGQLVEVLLVQRGQPPFLGSWALPGGFVNIDEPLEAAARRELEEETGIVGFLLNQERVYGDPQRDPRGRVISVAYSVILPREKWHLASPGSDAENLRWFPVNNLPSLAFDHQQIIRDTFEQFNNKQD
jgi:8-oxo-dGTP diphosphatase